MSEPALTVIADSYGIELRHPIRDGRRAGQIGRKGLSNHRWISGGKLCAEVKQYDGPMIALADRRIRRAAGDPPNVPICRRGQWNVRLTVETVFAMMRMQWDFKAQRHRAWAGFEAHLAYAMAGCMDWDRCGGGI